MALLVFLQTNLRPIALLLLVGAIFCLGWHFKGSLDDAEKNKALVAEHEKEREISQEYEVKVQTLSKHGVELDIALEAALEKDPNITDCELSDDELRVINSSAGSR